MFSRFLSQTRKTIRFRLSLWTSMVCILSSAILFCLAYLLLTSSLHQRDRSAIETRLEEYAGEYRRGGLEALKRIVDLDRSSSSDEPFLVRLADPRHQTILLKTTREAFDPASLDLKPLDKGARGQWTYIPARAEGENETLEVASVHLPDGRILQVGKGSDERDDVLERFRDICAGAVVAMVLLGFAGGSFLAGRALQPVRGLTNVLGPIIETGKIKARVPVRHTGDEVDDLSVLLNRMLEKIESLVDRMRASLDNAAHDLRTPLTRLRGTAEIALRSCPSIETYQEALADCIEESEYVLTMLNTLMDIAEVEAGAVRLDLQEVDVRGLIEGVVELYSCVAEEKDISVHSACPEQLSLTADPSRMRRVIANLLDNAIKYTPSDGRIDIEASAEDHEVVIRVRDTGVGISLGELPKIWDRLYRGERSRTQRGLGLGLSLVRAVVHAHKGRTEVLSDLGKGSQFVLRLPVNPPA